MSIITSFIIPHKGREEMLIRTLESIANQTAQANTYEVIVVSQNSDCSQTLNELTKSMPLRVIYNDTTNTISHSRNLGASAAKGEYFAFLDADVELANEWLDVMLCTLQEKSAALVSAMQIDSRDAPPLETIRTALTNAELDTDVSFLPGRNLFLHRSTFFKAGQFPEHLMTCEDYYFTDKVNNIGRLYYTSNTHYIHLGEDKAFVPMWKKEVWRGQSNIASLKGRKIPMREWPSFIAPFAVTGGLLLACLALVFTQYEAATFLFICMLLVMLLYTARLKKLTGKKVSIVHCALFYLLYFPARAIGTVLGVSGSVYTSSHK